MPRRSCSIPGLLCGLTSVRLWGCAGRSYPSHSTSRSPPTWWERGAQREQLAPIQPQAGIGRVLVWACFVRRKFSPHLAYSDRKRASGCSHATSKHRAASAGLLATAGEPASCTFLMPCIRNARVPQAAAGLRLERRRRWHVRASPSQSLRSDRGCSPRMAFVCSLQQCSGCILHLR